jgi:hypothetical protein
LMLLLLLLLLLRTLWLLKRRIVERSKRAIEFLLRADLRLLVQQWLHGNTRWTMWNRHFRWRRRRNVRLVRLLWQILGNRRLREKLAFDTIRLRCHSHSRGLVLLLEWWLKLCDRLRRC